jgi:hypothetical protein
VSQNHVDIFLIRVFSSFIYSTLRATYYGRNEERSAFLYWRYSKLPPLLLKHNLQHIVFLFSFLGWGETESTWYCGHYWPIVPAPDDRWWWVWSSRWNENWQGKPKYSDKICPSATLSTTNHTWPDLGSNPGRRCGKTATNRLSHDKA